MTQRTSRASRIRRRARPNRRATKFPTSNFQLPRRSGVGSSRFGIWDLGFSKVGAPDRIRTCGLQLRRLPLYPAELRAPKRNFAFAFCIGLGAPGRTRTCGLRIEAATPFPTINLSRTRGCCHANLPQMPCSEPQLDAGPRPSSCRCSSLLERPSSRRFTVMRYPIRVYRSDPIVATARPIR